MGGDVTVGFFDHPQSQYDKKNQFLSSFLVAIIHWMYRNKNKILKCGKKTALLYCNYFSLFYKHPSPLGIREVHITHFSFQYIGNGDHVLMNFICFIRLDLLVSGTFLLDLQNLAVNHQQHLLHLRGNLPQLQLQLQVCPKIIFQDCSIRPMIIL